MKTLTICRKVEKFPRLLRETPLSKLWYKKDDCFWIPKAVVTIEICTPSSNDSPRSSVLTQLYCDLVEDSLSETTYDARLAGLTFDINPSSRGFSIDLYGYNEKLVVLLKRLLDHINTPGFDTRKLDVIKEQVYSMPFIGHLC